MNVHQIVEAVLFASDAPLTPDEIARADEMLDEDQVQDALQHLTAEYDDAGRAFQLLEVAEGYQILTRPEFNPYLERFDNVPRISRLSGPALETLAIIAYRQPIGRLEIEYVRGVGASGVIRTLQDRRLIDVVGRAEGLGRPLLYGTTRTFLEHFGFKSLEDLPRPDDLPVVLRERIPFGVDGDEGTDSSHVQTGLALGSGDGATAAEGDGGDPVSPTAGDEETQERVDAETDAAQAVIDAETDDDGSGAATSRESTDPDDAADEPEGLAPIGSEEDHAAR